MASENLGASFSIDIAQLKAGLSQANSLIRESESEFKAAAAGMDNWQSSQEGVEAKIKSLNSVTEVQKEKVRALKEQYQNLINEGLDPTSKRATDLRTNINKEEAALASNEKELQKQEKALEDVGEETEKASTKVSKFGEIAKAAGKVAAAAFTAAAAAVGAIIKQSVEGYADYEQLVGGVETLFGAGGKSIEEYAASVGKSVSEVQGEYNRLMRSQQMVLDNASTAYQTAGLSQNEYIETVTGFSAALLDSLGGDTISAAMIADTAITDMSDNANKMGSDIESIQNAYAGFSKGQFTMLDNLKLGYGGTKTEMERLLANAEKISGVKYDISSYADIVSAIHVVQEEMGIMGTTQKEAAQTISGSIAATKASYANLMTGLADENANLKQLTELLVSNVVAVMRNVMPVVNQIVSAIPVAIQEILPLVPQLIGELLPPLIEAVTVLISGVVEVLPTIIDSIVALAPDLLSAILGMLPDILSAAIEVVLAVINGTSAMLPNILPEIINAIMMIIQTLIQSVPDLLDAAITLLMAIVEAIPLMIEVLVKELPSIIMTILENLLDAIPQILDGAIQLLMAIVDAIPIIIQMLIPMLPEIITTVLDALLDGLPMIIEGAIQLFMAIVEAIPTIIPELVKAVPDIIMSIVEIIKEGVPKVFAMGKELIKGLWNGIKDMKQWVIDKIKGFGGDILGGIKDFFGIKSPSKVMENIVGKNIALGIGEGFEKNIGNVNKQIQGALDDPSINVNAQFSNGEHGAGKGNVTVYQTNNYSQAHSRLELYKTKQQTAAAVRLALGV